MALCKCKSPSVRNPLSQKCEDRCPVGMTIDAFYNCEAMDEPVVWDLNSGLVPIASSGEEAYVVDSCTPPRHVDGRG
jgi:hypothetical protein